MVLVEYGLTCGLNSCLPPEATWMVSTTGYVKDIEQDGRHIWGWQLKILLAAPGAFAEVQPQNGWPVVAGQGLGNLRDHGRESPNAAATLPQYFKKVRPRNVVRGHCVSFGNQCATCQT